MTEEMIRTNALRVLCAQVQEEPQHVVLDTHLEGELRIDETGLAGVLAALRAEFGLPADALSTRFVTVREVLDEVVVSARGPQAPAAAPVVDHRDTVLEVFRHHTHYAANELRGDADLEGELGVDSVLLASILGDLGKRLGLAKGAFKPGTIRTIDDVLGALRKMNPVEPIAAAPEMPRVGEKWRDAPPAPPPASDGDARTLKDFTEERTRDLFGKVRAFNEFYKKRRDEQLFWYGMPLETACRNRAVIFDEVTGKRREFLMFASNNYLGLANDPRVVEAVCSAVRAYGATNTG